MKYIKDPKVIPRLYKVSQEGEVFKVHKGYMKRLNPYLFNIGIPSVSLKCKDGKFRFFKLSRLVAFAYVNNLKNYPIVCHIDNDYTNNHASNLYWGTYKWNMQQASMDKRFRHKLSDMDRHLIYYLVNYHGVSKVKLAKHFDISITTLRRVFLDDRWDFYYPKKLKLTKTKQKS